MKQPLIIAGPCSAESRSQILSTANALSRIGIDTFRAGLWKPRTKPGGFEGVGEEGIPWLVEAKHATGMKIVTEVATQDHVAKTLQAGFDALWIGARTTANPFAVQEIADTISAHKPNRLTVMVKNPMHPDIELWIGAIERLRRAGVEDIWAIHRGFSIYFGQNQPHITYRNEPIWRIPLELRRRCPDLKIIVDPSHIGGSRSLIEPLSQKALDIGFDGLMIETHIEPDNALSDSAQQITPATLSHILSSLNHRRHPLPAAEIEDYRRQIDRLDSQLLDLLSQRMAVSRKIGRLKSQSNAPVVQPQRYNSMIDQRISQASALSLSPKFVKSIFETIHEESVSQQLSPHKS